MELRINGEKVLHIWTAVTYTITYQQDLGVEPNRKTYSFFLWNLLTAIDSVVQANIKRVQQILQRTFWAIPAAHRYCQACMEMAKRGLNVDQLAIFLGPGGVGLTF